MMDGRLRDEGLFFKASSVAFRWMMLCPAREYPAKKEKARPVFRAMVKKGPVDGKVLEFYLERRDNG